MVLFPASLFSQLPVLTAILQYEQPVRVFYRLPACCHSVSGKVARGSVPWVQAELSGALAVGRTVEGEWTKASKSLPFHAYLSNFSLFFHRRFAFISSIADGRLCFWALAPPPSRSIACLQVFFCSAEMCASVCCATVVGSFLRSLLLGALRGWWKGDLSQVFGWF